MYTDSYFGRFILPKDTHEALKNSRTRCYPESKAQLYEMCFGPTHSSRFDVCYSIKGKGMVKEADVVRCKNGTVIKCFFHAFRIDLKQSLGLTVLYAVIFTVLLLDCVYFYGSASAAGLLALYFFYFLILAGLCGMTYTWVWLSR